MSHSQESDKDEDSRGRSRSRATQDLGIGHNNNSNSTADCHQTDNDSISNGIRILTEMTAIVRASGPAREGNSLAIASVTPTINSNEPKKICPSVKAVNYITEKMRSRSECRRLSSNTYHSDSSLIDELSLKVKALELSSNESTDTLVRSSKSSLSISSTLNLKDLITRRGFRQLTKRHSLSNFNHKVHDDAQYIDLDSGSYSDSDSSTLFQLPSYTLPPEKTHINSEQEATIKKVSSPKDNTCQKCIDQVVVIGHKSKAAVAAVVSSTISLAAHAVAPVVSTTASPPPSFFSSTAEKYNVSKPDIVEKTFLPSTPKSDASKFKTVAPDVVLNGAPREPVFHETVIQPVAQPPVATPPVSLPTPQSVQSIPSVPSSSDFSYPDDELEDLDAYKSDTEFLDYLAKFAGQDNGAENTILGLEELSAILDKPGAAQDLVLQNSKAQNDLTAPGVSANLWTEINRIYVESNTQDKASTDLSASSDVFVEKPAQIATHRFTTSFVQQILTRHGYSGELDSLEALDGFNNLAHSGLLDPHEAEPVAKLEIMQVPAVGALAVEVGSSANVERPPSPVQESRLNNMSEEMVVDDSVSEKRVSSSHLTLAQRFRHIGGINTLFPGLNPSRPPAGDVVTSQNSSSSFFVNAGTNRESGQYSVEGINQVPLGPNDPMSISRLTNPTSETAYDSHGSYSVTATSPDFNSLSAGVEASHMSSINSLLLGAAYNSSYGPTTPPTISHSQTRTFNLDDDEDEQDSVYGNNGSTTSESSGSRSTIPSTVSSNDHVTQSVHPSAGGPTRVKPRKQQCTECNGWFSNIQAHRLTHLSSASRPYSCSVCARGFSRPNDLLRHEKSHQGDLPYNCPFYTADHKCHSSGGFSRCDTYKNHLKAMHFEYPFGLKKKDRNGASGKCKECQLEFETADEWIVGHVDAGKCEHFAGLRMGI
ncbi:hypothetical protein V1512DRAFT_246699 [Lipomyces arxii]|uniref:uncharacterized protein n=1 Tax=Lipomyces arxii TaxID=56418 RepID=UPI0034CF0323